MRTRNQEREEEEGLRPAKKSAEDAPIIKPKTPKNKNKRKSLTGTSVAAVEMPEEAPPATAARKKMKAAVEPPSAGPEDDGAGSGSEDEAPEEISLSSGKMAAQKQVEEEKKERAEGRKASKKRRRSKAGADEESRGVGKHLDMDAQEALDVLPPEIIAALQKQAKEEASNSAQDSMQRKTLLEEGAELVEVEKLPYRQDGPVTVRILDNTSKPSFNPSESAKEYAKQRLYGARLKRSNEMLHPVGGGRIVL